MDLLQWWNLVFLLPAVAALLYLLLLALGALPAEGDHGDIHLEPGDAHFEPGLHVEIHGTHFEIHPHDVIDDIPHGEHHDTDPFRGALSLIGVGRIPLSLVLMSFLFLWGFFGWAANQFFASVLPSPALFIWPSLAPPANAAEAGPHGASAAAEATRPLERIFLTIAASDGGLLMNEPPKSDVPPGFKSPSWRRKKRVS